MKLWEMVIEAKIRRKAQVTVNQCQYMLELSTTEPRLTFIDLEKAYNNVSCWVIWDTIYIRGEILVSISSQLEICLTVIRQVFEH